MTRVLVVDDDPVQLRLTAEIANRAGFKPLTATGGEQALAILRRLAIAPTTARHIATKLARHFAGDVPAPALVDRLADAFLRSGGDLPTVGIGVAVVFLFSAIFSYVSIRTESRPAPSRFCEQVADNLFIVGLVGITTVAFVFAYEIL